MWCQFTLGAARNGDVYQNDVHVKSLKSTVLTAQNGTTVGRNDKTHFSIIQW
jgi:hypothetical protein